MECVTEGSSPATSTVKVRLSFKNSRPCGSILRRAPFLSRAIIENRASPIARDTASPLTVGVVVERLPFSNTTISSSSRLLMTSEVIGACMSSDTLRCGGCVVVVVVVEVVDVVRGAVDGGDDV